MKNLEKVTITTILSLSVALNFYAMLPMESVESVEIEPGCGGIEKVSCPSGYQCVGERKDRMGVCKKMVDSKEAEPDFICSQIFVDYRIEGDRLTIFERPDYKVKPPPGMDVIKLTFTFKKIRVKKGVEIFWIDLGGGRYIDTSMEDHLDPTDFFIGSDSKLYRCERRFRPD